MSKKFDDALHTQILSEDGSYTAYSKEYEEHYHSTRDGALFESMKKHVVPAFNVIQKDEVNILDICYGLGFNTLATLLYIEENFPKKKIYIYSPELDSSVVKSLVHFKYPKVFEKYKKVITALSERGVYASDKLYIELFFGDAREYILKFKNKFDIVYQDPFSPSTNPILWTKEYFRDIKDAMREEGVLTTYSIALKVRVALHENGFYLYLNEGRDYRVATVASRKKLEQYKSVDMQHKIACNPGIKSLRDSDV